MSDTGGPGAGGGTGLDTAGGGGSAVGDVISEHEAETTETARSHGLPISTKTEEVVSVCFRSMLHPASCSEDYRAQQGSGKLTGSYVLFQSRYTYVNA